MLWNAGQVVADYLQQHVDKLVKGQDVLELGAGAGLPGLVSAVLGAKRVMWIRRETQERQTDKNYRWSLQTIPI